MIFANIEYLFLLVLLIPYIVWYVMKRKKTEPTLQVSTTRMYMKAPKSWKIYLLHTPFVLRTVAIIMVILILARPQTTDNWQNTEIEGIDIMLAVDVSTSMLAEDLKPNRLEAAKQVASEFINGRPNDNIGLTIFAGESFTQCPLTVDHGVLLNLFNSIKGDIAQRGLIEDGTAIGMGIAALAYVFLMIFSFTLPAKDALSTMSAAEINAIRVTPWIMIGLYFILTVAELFISPLGLSFVSKVAPPHLQGLMQGCWLAATAVGNSLLFVGGILYTTVPIWACWLVFVGATGASMIVMLSMVKWLERVAK